MIPTIFGKTVLQRVMLALLAATLSGCFDDGSGSDNPVGDEVSELPTPANQAPEVRGNPNVSATAGQLYTFKPEASDPDGDFLEFSITNKPSWASFDDESGLLSGTPDDADVGDTEEITITVTDGRDTRSVGPFRIRILGRTDVPLPGNNPPTISGEPAPTVLLDQPYSFTPEASDPDGDELRFSISNTPSWASFDTATGTLSGTPDKAGTYSGIEISVDDGNLKRTLPAFSIQVQAPDNNRAPTISGTPATKVEAKQTYTFQVSASDPDGDRLVYRINQLPRWATFSTASGRLRGTPTLDDVGSYANLIITVSDGIVSTSLPPFSIEVTKPVNRAPTISGTAATTATVGVGYSFTPTASDPNGDSLGFSIEGRPSWASFDTTTGRLSGTPTAATTYSNIVISVNDGELSAALPAFSIKVNPPSNPAPVISGVPATTVAAGSTYNFLPGASDANGDSLTFSIQNAPSWANFDTSNGRLSGTPSATDAGTYANIVISVRDGVHTVSLPSFTITVTPPSTGSATLSWTPPTRNSDGTALTNLAGYRVVYGRNSAALDQVREVGSNVSSYTITGLTSGTWYFAVKSFNNAGVESDVSNTGTKTIP